jgi:hypothetical protein
VAFGVGAMSRWLLVSVAFSSLGCSVLIDTDPAKLSAGSGGTCTPECDDGIPCTIDECGADNKCRYKPSAEACDDGVKCTEDICDPKSGCTNKPSDERCEFCAPGSTCDAKLGGCVGYTSRRNCADDDPCTKDDCDVATMMCIAEDVDEDGDGHAPATVADVNCGGKDCDDTRAGVYPGAPEACNGRDDDCNGKVDDGCMDTPDTCESVVDVMLSELGTGVIEGSFAAVEANYDVPCGSEDAPDAVYRIPVTLDSADIAIETVGDSAELVLAGGTGCGEADFRLGCGKPLARGGTRLSFHRYNASALFLLVDAKDKGETGNYRIKVSVTRAATDLCLPTSFDLSGCGTVVGSMSNEMGQLLGSCQPGGLLVRGASEAVFRITGNTDKLTLQASGQGFSPALYTRDSCGGFSSDIDCDVRQNGDARLEVEPSEGTTYVVLDGAQPGQAYTLTCGP